MGFPDGPQQGAPLNFPNLDSFEECYQVVRSADDLPDPGAGGERVLAPNTGYFLCGTIVLPDDESLRVGVGTVLAGRDVQIDGLVGNVDGPLVTSDVGCQIQNTFYRNDSTAPGSSALRISNVNDRNNLARVQGNCSLRGQVSLLVEDCIGLFVDGGVFRYREAGARYVGPNPSGNLIVSPRACLPDPGGDPEAPAHDFVAGSIVQGFVSSEATYSINDLQAVVRLDPAATFLLGQFSESQVIPGLFGGPPTAPLVGLTPDSIESVLFQDVFGLAESSFGAQIEIVSNAIPTLIVPPGGQGLGVFVPIGYGSPGHPVWSVSAGAMTDRFEIVGGETQLQRLRYKGPEPVRVLATATASVRQADIYQLLAATRVEYFAQGLPAPVAAPAAPPAPTVAGPGLTTVLADGFSGGGATATLVAKLPIQLNPGDQLGLSIANFTDTVPNPLADLILDSCVWGFERSA